MQPGERVLVSEKLGITISSAPLPGMDASEEALIVLGCQTGADFAALAPTFGETAISSLTKAIETPVFLERLAGVCPGGLVVRVPSYRVENKSG